MIKFATIGATMLALTTLAACNSATTTGGKEFKNGHVSIGVDTNGDGKYDTQREIDNNGNVVSENPIN